MDTANINAAVATARTDAPPAAVAKAPDDGSFGETLKAGMAVESTDTQTPAPATVGKSPEAMMRPPDASSAEDVAKIAAIGADNVAEAAKPNAAAQRMAVSAPPVNPQTTKKATPEDPKTTSRDNKKDASKDASTEDVQPVVADTPITNGTAQQLPLFAPSEQLAQSAQFNASTTSELKTASAKKLETKKLDDPTASISAPLTKLDSGSIASSIPALHDNPTAPAATSSPLNASTSITVPQADASPSKHTSSGHIGLAAATGTPAAPTGLGDPATLTATPGVLEVGVASSTHGWLRIRAELGQAGEVTASLAASTAAASEGLHKDLPAISAYLAQERVNVSALVVTSIDRGTGAQDAAMSSGAGGAGQQQRRSSNATDASQQPEDDSSDPGSFALGGIALPAALYGGPSGGWLSIRV